MQHATALLQLRGSTGDSLNTDSRASAKPCTFTEATTFGIQRFGVKAPQGSHLSTPCALKEQPHLGYVTVTLHDARLLLCRSQSSADQLSLCWTGSCNSSRTQLSFLPLSLVSFVSSLRRPRLGWTDTNASPLIVSHTRLLHPAHCTALKD